MGRKFTLASSLCLLAALALGLASGSRAKTRPHGDEQTPSTVNSLPVTLDLKDFGAAGDGMTDDGPALQAALDALAATGGGTLFVPAGRYAIVTPVSKSFAELGASVTISGVASGVAVPPPTANGQNLTEGLGLTSEFLPRTGTAGAALVLAGLRGAAVNDIAFVGTPGVVTDAACALFFLDVDDATVSHCEFYGLNSSSSGSDLIAVRSSMKIDRSVFLGCNADSGAHTSVVQNVEWKGFTIEDAVFADYGRRPELFGKLGLGAPYSWVELGNAAAVTNDSPRREAVFRSVFMDEGALYGIASLPGHYTQPLSAPVDLVYVTGLWMNVSNLNASGNYLTDLRAALVENSAYGWSHQADAAINLAGVGNAILDRVETAAAATRLRADAATGRLTVIDSTYTELASLSPQTLVINTTQPDEDPVQYVREQFESALGRAPDAAAHFYWSDRILRCGADAECVASARSALGAYLGSSPSETFGITGRVADENDTPLAGVVVTLLGSQTVATTDAAGLYHFSNLPTSGVYTIKPSKPHYVFAAPSLTFTTPGAAARGDFAAVLLRHTISGRVTSEAGLAGATLTLTGSQYATTTSDADGNYSFTNLVVGGSYTITPSKADYVFAPASLSFTDLSADARADFNGTTRSIFGLVVNVNNAGLPGITVTLSGSRAATTTTAADGSYRFDQLAAVGSYVVKPTLLGYVFSPASQSFENLPADRYAGFVGNYFEYGITGRVAKSDGTAVYGVTVSLAGSKTAATTTDSNGNYKFTGLPSGGDYTVTPSKTDYSFGPTARTLSALGSDRTASFTATPGTHAIHGRVGGPVGGALSGSLVTLSGSRSATATADADGDYSFAQLPSDGVYTVTASKANYIFTPPSQTFDQPTTDKTADFAGALVNNSIAGRVTEGASGLAGVTVSLTGTKTATATTDANGSYSFNVPAEGSYTVTSSKKEYAFEPTSASFGAIDGDRAADFAAMHKEVIEFGSAALSVNEGGGTLDVTVTRSGDTSEEVSAVYEVQSGTALSGSDVVGSAGRITFAPGETTKTFTLFITDDSLVEGAQQFTVGLTPEGDAVAGALSSVAVTINDNDTDASAANAVDDSEFFVRQHYRDFLGRDPDDSGLRFWTNQITQCGADSACRDGARVNVSAAFFLSLEFQQTGFFVYKTYGAAYGRTPERLQEFTLDAQKLSAGVIVGETGWEQKLEANKVAYVEEFVAREEFESRYPLSLTPAQLVSALDANAGGSLTSDERDAAVAEFGGARDTQDISARARVLRRVVENGAFHRRETNPAFVLMQYFGYLRRAPDEPPDANLDGYNFWLKKLDSFGGDFRRAEMVKAFLASDEYRKRFGK